MFSRISTHCRRQPHITFLFTFSWNLFFLNIFHLKFYSNFLFFFTSIKVNLIPFWTNKRTKLYHQQKKIKEWDVNWSTKMKPEKNIITSAWFKIYMGCNKFTSVRYFSFFFLILCMRGYAKILFWFFYVKCFTRIWTQTQHGVMEISEAYIYSNKQMLLLSLICFVITWSKALTVEMIWLHVWFILMFRSSIDCHCIIRVIFLNSL